MPAKDLQSFLKELEADGDLVRIKDEVDPILEISEIADRAMQLPGGGPALLFEKPKGAKFPLAINVLGAERRMLKAFGMANYSELGERVHGRTVRQGWDNLCCAGRPERGRVPAWNQVAWVRSSGCSRSSRWFGPGTVCQCRERR